MYKRQPLDDVVGADAGPMLEEKIRISQGFFYTVLDLFGGIPELHLTQFHYHGRGLLPGSLLALLCVDRLEHLGNELHLGFGHNGEYIAVEVHYTCLLYTSRCV